MRQLGEYAIEGPLGAGGMGVVLRGRAPDGRVVAIKVVQRPDAGTALRFSRERRLLGSFGAEDGFVPLLDAGEAPQGPYLVMPLIEGGTLRDRLERGATLSIEAALELGRRLAASIARAHARGVIHRDLKPENVLFTQRGAEPATWGVPLIADLGLAKHFRREDLGGSKSLTLTNAGEFRGTMCYMAPEQMKDAGAVGPAADVFSIGVILYEALAGHPAFESNDVLELVRKVNEGEYTPLRRERGDLPRWLEEVVDRALETDPARRFQDGHELARALRGARIGGPWRGPTALAVLGGGALIAATLAFAKLAQPDPGRRVPEAPPRHAISSQTTTALPATLPATVEELDRLMRQRYEKKDWKGVAEVAQRVIELDSSFIRAWAYLGEVHCTQGEYEKALGEYDVVVDANPDSVAARLGRAKCRYNLKRWEGVAEDMERAIVLGTTEPIAWEMRGVARSKLRDFAGALEDLNAAESRGVRTANVYGERGAVFLALGRREEGIEDLTRALEQEKRHELHANRGIALRELGRYAEALGDFDAAIALEASVSIYHANRGATLLELKRIDEALAAVEKALALGDRDAYTYTTLGRIHEAVKNDDAAFEAYTRGIAAAPDKPWCYVNRANIKLRRKDPRGAAEDATSAIERDKRIGAAFIARGNARHELGELEGALADYDKAIELGVALGYKNRASVKRTMGDLDGAVADVETFLTIPPIRPPDDPTRFVLRSLKAEAEKKRAESSSRGR